MDEQIYRETVLLCEELSLTAVKSPDINLNIFKNLESVIKLADSSFSCRDIAIHQQSASYTSSFWLLVNFIYNKFEILDDKYDDLVDKIRRCRENIIYFKYTKPMMKDIIETIHDKILKLGHKHFPFCGIAGGNLESNIIVLCSMFTDCYFPELKFKNLFPSGGFVGYLVSFCVNLSKFYSHYNLKLEQSSFSHKIDFIINSLNFFNESEIDKSQEFELLLREYFSLSTKNDNKTSNYVDIFNTLIKNNDINIETEGFLSYTNKCLNKIGIDEIAYPFSTSTKSSVLYEIIRNNFNLLIHRQKERKTRLLRDIQQNNKIRNSLREKMQIETENKTEIYKEFYEFELTKIFLNKFRLKTNIFECEIEVEDECSFSYENIFPPELTILIKNELKNVILREQVVFKKGTELPQNTVIHATKNITTIEELEKENLKRNMFEELRKEFSTETQFREFLKTIV